MKTRLKKIKEFPQDKSMVSGQGVKIENKSIRKLVSSQNVKTSLQWL